MRTSVVAPYACYLRVYEPLTAFPRSQRAGWRAYLRQAPAAPREAEEIAAAEQRDSLAAAVVSPGLPGIPRDEPRRAYLLVDDEVTYLCPVETQLRAWLALEELWESAPPRLMRTLAGPGVRERVLADLTDWRAGNPDRVAHIQTRTWRVPMAWFLAFDDGERDCVTSPSRRLRYRARMVDARRRLNRSYAALRRTLPNGQAMRKVTELGRWLESFHPHSRVELDYGGLVHLVDEESLAADRSAAEAARAFGLLADGDLTAAREVHGRLERRWRAVAAKETAS